MWALFFCQKITKTCSLACFGLKEKNKMKVNGKKYAENFAESNLISIFASVFNDILSNLKDRPIWKLNK